MSTASPTPTPNPPAPSDPTKPRTPRDLEALSFAAAMGNPDAQKALMGMSDADVETIARAKGDYRR